MARHSLVCLCRIRERSSLRVKQAIAGANLLLIMIDLTLGKQIETVVGHSLEWLLATTVMGFHLSFVHELSGARLTLTMPAKADEQPASAGGIEAGLLRGS